MNKQELKKFLTEKEFDTIEYTEDRLVEFISSPKIMK